MGFFRKKRQSISMSRLFSETLFLALRETNAKCVGTYLESVRDEFREPLAQNWEPYACLLVKYLYTDFLATRRLRVVGMPSDGLDIESAWRHGLELARQWHCAQAGSYREKLKKCLAAIGEYSVAHKSHRADAGSPPMDHYFSACEHFGDLVVGNRLFDRTLAFETAMETGVTARDTQASFAVFEIAKDIFEVTLEICVASAQTFEVDAA